MAMTIPQTNEFLVTVTFSDSASSFERIFGLLRRRAPSFSSVSVVKGDQHTLYMTIQIPGTADSVEQVAAQLRKLEHVQDSRVFADHPATGTHLSNQKEQETFVVREYAVASIAVADRTKRDILALVHHIGARIIDFDTIDEISATANAKLTIEMSGSPREIDAAIDQLNTLGPCEVFRTGNIALRVE